MSLYNNSILQTHINDYKITTNEFWMIMWWVLFCYDLRFLQRSITTKENKSQSDHRYYSLNIHKGNDKDVLLIIRLNPLVLSTKDSWHGLRMLPLHHKEVWGKEAVCLLSERPRVKFQIQPFERFRNNAKLYKFYP